MHRQCSAWQCGIKWTELEIESRSLNSNVNVKFNVTLESALQSPQYYNSPTTTIQWERIMCSRDNTWLNVLSSNAQLSLIAVQCRTVRCSIDNGTTRVGRQELSGSPLTSSSPPPSSTLSSIQSSGSLQSPFTYSSFFSSWNEISGRNKSVVNVQLHQRGLINKGYSDIGSKEMHFHSRETPLAVVSVYSEDSFPRLGNSNVYIDIDMTFKALH